MSTELMDCPNCGTKIKSGFISSVRLIMKNEVDIINEFHSKKAESYCTKCGTELYTQYKLQLLDELESLQKQIQEIIQSIPVISLQNPLQWDYEVIGMVTGQSTTGTGIISELTSSFTDLFGMQSNRFNKKLKGGEDLCFSQLRKQTLDAKGNAVIAVDIDYADVGGEKGMLMVCMTGTAINLKNTGILGEQRAKDIETVKVLYERLSHLNTFDTTKYIPS